MPGRLSREALVFRALCVLEEAVEESRKGAVPPSPGLRLALAYLYAVGDRRREWFDREPYDGFWRLATQQDANFSAGSNVDATGRLTQLTAHLNGIGRAAGMEVDVTVLQAIRRARGII